MEILKVKSRLDYVTGLQLATTTKVDEKLFKEKVVSFKEEGEAAATVAGSTVSFIGGVPMQKQQDVLNSTLLAQLAANKAFDREKQTEQWYGKYKEVLENIGWVIQNFSFNRQSSSGTTVQMDKVALDILAAAMSGNELAVLTATIKALKDADPNSKEITLFDTNGSSGEGGNFQLSTASLDPNGNVKMSLGAFYFSASEHQTRFLFFSWSTRDLNLYAGVQGIILNEQIYATVRQAIIEKLGDKAQTYVANINI
jgi:hypothetical protein